MSTISGNLENNDFLSFVESVSSSNLETFHSKAIAWLLNSLDRDNSWFEMLFKKVKTKVNDSVIHLGTIAEFKNHDLITLLQVENRLEIIFWENKIKADFHQVKLSKTFINNIDCKKINKNKIEDYISHWNRGISQPFYYQLRYYAKDNKKQIEWIKDIISKIRELEFKSSDINLNNIKLNWLILSPYDQNELETFNREQWIGIKTFAKSKDIICGDKNLLEEALIGQDPINWNFTTFEQLFSSLKFKDSKIVQNTYINYLRKENWFQTANKLNVSDNNVNDLQEWTVNSLFKVYESIIKNKNLSVEFNWSISGSSRSQHPLLNICFVEDLILFNDPFNDKNKFNRILDFESYKSKNNIPLVDKIICKLQLQGKSMKLQISHWDYNNVKLRKNRAKDYARIVTEKLTGRKIIKDNFEHRMNVWLSPTEFEVSKTNFPSTKTGFSFTLKEKSNHSQNQINKIPTVDKIIKFCCDVSALSHHKNR